MTSHSEGRRRTGGLARPTQPKGFDLCDTNTLRLILLICRQVIYSRLSVVDSAGSAASGKGRTFSEAFASAERACSSGEQGCISTKPQFT